METWAQCAGKNVDSFEDGNITNYHEFMNYALIKYNKVVGGNNGKFRWSSTSIQDDIVSMFGKAKKSSALITLKQAGGDQTDDKKKRNISPFIIHFKFSEEVNTEK